jgi:hypothetical protein
MLSAVAAVDHGLENLDFLASDLGPLYSAQKFFGLAAEHAAANDFNRSTELSPSAIVHYCFPLILSVFLPTRDDQFLE